MSDLERPKKPTAIEIGQSARIEALEAELAAAKTVNREVLYRENDELRALNDKMRDDVGALKARIEALEAALDACIGAMGEGGSCSIIQWTDALSNARAARAALITEGGGDE